MSSIIHTQPWTRQPQIPVGPNKGTKFGQNCFALWSAITPNRDLSRPAMATSWVQGSPLFTVGPYGRSLSDDSGGQNALVTIGGSLTTTVPFSFTTVSVLRAFSGGNATTFLQLGSSTAGVAIGHDTGKQMYISFGNGRGALYMDTPGYITVPDNDTDWFVVATSWQEPSNGRMVIYNLTTGTWKEATGTFAVGDWAAPGLNGTYTVGDVRGAGWQKYTRFVMNAASFGSSTSGELRSLCLNPWQVFAPLSRRIFVGPSAGGATTRTATATLDAAIREAKTATATLDAAIRQTNTATATLDGVIVTRNTATATLDAAIQSGVTATVTLDAAIQAAMSATATLDAVIQTAGSSSATVTLDAAIREGKSLTATLDAAIQIANTGTATLDARIVSVNTATATLDATIREAVTAFALLDAYIFDAAAPAVEPDTRQTPAGKKTRNTRRRYIMPDDTIVMATPDEAEQLVKLFVKPKLVKTIKQAPKRLIKALKAVDLVDMEPVYSDTVPTEKITVKKKAVWDVEADLYVKAMRMMAERELKRRRHEEELILLS